MIFSRRHSSDKDSNNLGIKWLLRPDSAQKTRYEILTDIVPISNGYSVANEERDELIKKRIGSFSPEKLDTFGSLSSKDPTYSALLKTKNEQKIYYL